MNSIEHLGTGGICGWYMPEILEKINIFVDSDPVSRFRYALFSAFGGVLPDLIEPANNPHHRKFFHSVTLAGSILTGLSANNNHNSELLKQNPLFLAVVVGYYSHLFLDSLTEMSLPLV